MSIAAAETEFLPPWIGDIDLLLDELRRRQFSIGVGEHTKVIMLLDHLMKQQESILTANQLIQWLAPVVCNTPDQKQQLETLLLEREARFDLNQGVSSDSPSVDTSSEPSRKRKPFFSIRNISIAVILLVLVVTVVINGGFDFLSNTQNEGINPALPDNPDAQSTQGFSLLKYVAFSWPEFSKEYVFQLMIAFGLMGWSGWRLYQLRNQTLKLARQTTNQELNEKPIHYQLDFASLFSGMDLSHPIQILRKHIDVDSHRLDVRKTLAATIQSGGKVVIKEGTRPQLPEYMLLSRKSSSEDHHGALAENLVQRLQKEQIFVKPLEYILDPRRCRDEQGNVVNLADMQGGQLHQRLLMIDDAEAFFIDGSYHVKPWFDLIQRWNWVAILTPKPPHEWGKYEMLLAEMGVHLQSVSPQGISTLASRLQEEAEPAAIRPGDESARLWNFLSNESYRWTQHHSPDINDIEKLKRFLKSDLPRPAFELLCCLAVLPVLTPNLTLYLAQALRDMDEHNHQDSLEEIFSYLSRLPWFKEGYMPDWLREILIQQIPYQLNGRVRSICQSMMANDLSDKDGNFVLKIADQPQGQLQRLVTRFSEDDDAQWQDYIFLGFIEGNSNLQLDIKQQSDLAKEKNTSLSIKQIAYALLGLLPAILLLPHSELAASLMSVAYLPFDATFKAVADVDELVPYLFAGATLGSLLLMVISYHQTSKTLHGVVRWMSLLPFVLALLEMFLVTAYDKYEEVTTSTLLVVSLLFCGFVWLRPGERMQSDTLRAEFQTRYWGRAFILILAVLSLYTVNVYDVEDVYYDRPFTLGDIADESVHHMLFIGSIVLSTLLVWRYAFSYSFRHTSSMYRLWQSFLSVFVYFVSLYAGWVALQIVTDEMVLFTAIIAQALAVVVTANYFSRYCDRDYQQAYVQSLNQLLIPWLLLSCLVVWLAWSPLADVLDFSEDPRSLLGLGIYLWLAGAISIRKLKAKETTQKTIHERRYMIWGGAIIILSTLIVIGIKAADTVTYFYSTDFWTLALMLPLARLTMPALFLTDATAPTKKAIPKTYWLLLPLFSLVPIFLTLATSVYMIDMPTVYPGLCLVPFGIWLATKYGRHAHWSFMAAYVFYFVTAFSDVSLENYLRQSDHTSDFLMYLLLANFTIYLLGKVTSWDELISINMASKKQWLFLLIAIGVSINLTLTDSVVFWWNGFILALPMLLLLSLSNLNFKWPLMLASAVTALSVLSNIWVTLADLESRIIVNLTPNGLSSLLLIGICLLGFRLCLRSMNANRWLMPFIMMLTILHLGSLRFYIETILYFDLSNPLVVIVASLLAGMFLDKSITRFIMPMTVASLVLFVLFASLEMDYLNGFGFQWQISWEPILGLLVCCGLFYGVGRQAKGAIKEKQFHMDRLQDSRSVQTKMQTARPDIEHHSTSISLVASTSPENDFSQKGWPVFQPSGFKTSVVGVILFIWLTWFIYNVSDEFDDLFDLYDEVFSEAAVAPEQPTALDSFPNQTSDVYQDRPYEQAVYDQAPEKDIKRASR